MQKTDKFQFTWYEQDDFTSAIEEMQRWTAADAQLHALFAILGNGVLEGWSLESNSGFDLDVTPGSGHVTFVAVESTATTTVTLTPSSRNYIYAMLTPDSYWTKNVVFGSFLSLDEVSENLLVGYVDTDGSKITNINTDDRDEIGFRALIQEIVSEHRHIGGTDNPPPIDLSAEVTGILKQESLPNIDASLIDAGELDPKVLPDISHIDKVSDKGELTHAQLDSFVQTLGLDNQTLMGEVSTANLLQLILALKHVYPEIDEFLVNEVAFIPGVSPDSYIDTDNTTADVDTRTYAQGGTHKISGAASTGQTSYTRAWETTEELSSGTENQVFIFGDKVCLETERETLTLEDFDDVSDWETTINDSSNITAIFTKDSSTVPNSGNLSVDNTAVEVQLLLLKDFAAQDWSGYKQITFSLNTKSVEHGDLFFYFVDDNAGTQNSYTKVLARNTPTVNVETLANGWQEINVNLENFTKAAISRMGFYVSTQDGWDTAKGFDLQLQNMYLSSGEKYKTDGYARLRFGSDNLYNFWRLRWDANIPSDDQSTGVVFQTRTRVANSESGLDAASWSSYVSTSGSDIELPTDDLYSWIEIESDFTPSENLNRTPCLQKMYLDYYLTGEDNSFNYTTQDDWETASSLVNIDTETTSGSLLIKGFEDVGNTIYGTDGFVKILDSNNDEFYKIDGSRLPRSTYQILNNLPSGFGFVSGISRGDDGNIWVSDLDNDRVVEINKYGGLIRGFLGSFLVEPNTVIEEEDVEIVDTDIYSAIYNKVNGILYLVFNIEVDVLNINALYLKIGSQKYTIDNPVFNSIAMSNVENSHVLGLNISGATQTAINYSIDLEQPSITINSPRSNEMVDSSVTVRFDVNNFELSNGIVVTLDGSPQTIYTDRITYVGLSSGEHTISATLQDVTESLETNIEATASGLFIVHSGEYTQPYIWITTPLINQIYSSNYVSIGFEIDNFPILPEGQHIRYKLDAKASVEYYSTDNIIFDDLDSGEHTVQFWTVDETGNTLEFPYGSASISFIVGLNSNAEVRLHMEISGLNGSVRINNPVEVSNVTYTSIYSPIDVQYIPNEQSTHNPSGEPTVLISKLSVI